MRCEEELGFEYSAQPTPWERPADRQVPNGRNLPYLPKEMQPGRLRYIGQPAATDPEDQASEFNS
ncbi:MAG: hypothetical protein HZB38_17505 [Planctomycetes bacterium]|nr:hypothetical protein [Planctomycetota bacterium]